MDPKIRAFYERIERDAKYYGVIAKKLDLSDAQLALLGCTDKHSAQNSIMGICTMTAPSEVDELAFTICPMIKPLLDGIDEEPHPCKRCSIVETAHGSGEPMCKHLSLNIAKYIIAAGYRRALDAVVPGRNVAYALDIPQSGDPSLQFSPDAWAVKVRILATMYLDLAESTRPAPEAPQTAPDAEAVTRAELIVFYSDWTMHEDGEDERFADAILSRFYIQRKVQK